jgi:hypothetical protein
MAKRLGAVLAALLLAAGCGGASESSPPASAPTASPTADALSGAPEVGACRDLDVADQDASTVEKYVPCDGSYTSKVVAVTELPAGLSPASDATELLDFMFETCPAPAREILGGNQILRRTSLFQLLYFLPSQEQQDSGANWMSCDVTAGDEEGLIPLPLTTPFLEKSATDTQSIKRYAQCMRLNDDDTATLVGCDKEHILESGFVITFPDEAATQDVDALQACQDRYPAQAALILGGLPPRRSVFEDGGLPYITTCMIYDSEAGTL